MPPLSTPLIPVQNVFNDDMTFAYQQSAFCNLNYNSSPYHSSEQHGTRHTQYYGAEEGDESGDLCPLMLQVVLDLFDGVDYEDP